MLNLIPWIAHIKQNNGLVIMTYHIRVLITLFKKNVEYGAWGKER